ncbi:MAG: polysaccharide biosynthesis protein [Microbacteriaceae bacterium]
MVQRILIVGHGAAGRGLADDVGRRGDAVVVGFLDDEAVDEAVLGRLEDVNDVVAEHRVDLIYFAIPSVEARVVRDFVGLLESDSVQLAMIPRTYDIIKKDTVDISDLTDIDVLDLVGRRPVKHDLMAAREFIRGRRILVTGGAGSIGSRLVRQLLDMGPASIVSVDWWENGTFHFQRSLADPDAVDFRIGDVRNTAFMDQLLGEVRPEIVFHAAAYKHVPLMQANPREAIQNNVGGSVSLMRLAAEHGVGHVVYVSTDKAVNPVNVMGATKRLGEIAMGALAAQYPATRFTAVRFGNVIESNGSVMQIFRTQISGRLPLTVTHPDVTRYFMTLDEAAQLIIQSALLGGGSEIFVLDMGEPVRIFDLATSLVRVVDPSLEIEIIGMRPGEKMFEELSYEPDKVDTTSHASIFVVRDTDREDPGAALARIGALLEHAGEYDRDAASLVDELRGWGLPIA